MRLRVLIALAALALLVLAPEALGQEHGGGDGGPAAEGGSAEGAAPEGESSSEGGHAAEEEGGSFLVSPGLGLMIWTLILFGFTMWFLSKTAFPRIGEALEKRANAIKESIDAAEKQREEADELLKEYRHRLTEAREQADDIVARARKAAEAAVAEAASDGKAKREELVAAARKDIETETRRSLEQIRKEVADLTVLATEKVTRMSLDDDDHKRLIDDALKEVDFSALAGVEADGEGSS